MNHQRVLFLSDRSVGEEVKYVAQRTSFGPIDFGVLAACTGYRRELFVLYIKNLGEPAAGGSKPIGFEIGIGTFRTVPVGVFHFCFLKCDLFV